MARSGKTRRWLGGQLKRLVNGRLSRRRRALHAVKLLVLLGLTAAVLLGLYGLLLIPFTPSTTELKTLKHARPTIVLAAGGEELTRYARRHREWVDLEDVAPHVARALVATEDRRFYEHDGIDYWRMAGAAVRTLAGDRQGGSTITQQLARNLYPEEIGRAATVTRKLKEIITALKIEQAYTKEEILETYLNTVPFLYNAHGIELAARTYFGVSASELDVLQSATLVGMLKGTSYYNPVRHPERSRARRDVVLAQMMKHGELAAEDYEQLQSRPLEINFERQPVADSRAPHFTRRVREWLTDWADTHGYDIYAEGLVVHTTLDVELQTIAAGAAERYGEALQAVADVEWGRSSGALLSRSLWTYPRYREQTAPFAHFWDAQTSLVEDFMRETPAFERLAARTSEAAALEQLHGDAAFVDSLRRAKTRLEVSFTAIDPRTGHVKAWVGSRDHARAPYDHVYEARRQPGSTFKPFVYGAALEEGLRPDDRFRDREVTFRLAGGETWRPSNAGGTTGEVMTLREGLALSKNTITAQVVDEVGASDVAGLARRMGVRRSELREVPSLALGTSEVTLLEMTSSYATIAAGGTYRAPVYVTRIEDADGRVLASFEPESEQALEHGAALELFDMMRGVVDYGTGTGARRIFGIEADVAGKTGTTQHGADGWFMLMHPELVAGTWVGFDDPRVTFRSSYWGQGAHNALYVTGDVFAQALRRGIISGSRGLDRPEPDSRERRRTLADHVGRWLNDLAGRAGSLFDGDDRERAEEAREAREEWREHRREREREAREEWQERRHEAREERLERIREERERRRERERERRERRRERERDDGRRIGW